MIQNSNILFHFQMTMRPCDIVVCSVMLYFCKVFPCNNIQIASELIFHEVIFDHDFWSINTALSDLLYQA